MSFQYDRYGNRTAQTMTAGSGLQPSMSYNPANNQTTGYGAYQYDVAGNVIFDGLNNYTYDAENNLLTVSGATTASYIYNVFNERVRTTVNGWLLQYGYDLAGRRSTVWDTWGQLNIAQYYAGASRLAYWSITDGGLHFEHQDFAGSERVRTDAYGQMEGVYSSLPFGDSASVSGTDTNPGHFATLDQDADASLGLMHAKFREYHANSGRWLSPDSYTGSYKPGNPQSFNRYAYVLNNPVSYTDSSGLDCGDDGDNGENPNGCPGDGEDTGGAGDGGGDDGGGSNVGPITGGGDVPFHMTINVPLIPGDSGGGVDLTDNVTVFSPNVVGFGGLGIGGGISSGPSPVYAPNNVSQISQTACKAAAVAAGAAGGALAGGAAGGVAGGAGGTLVAPGVGTVGGAVVGAEGGATAGAWLGGIIGGGIGYVVGNAICSSGSGGGSGSKPSDAACHAIVQGAKNTCTNSFSGGGLSAWRNCVRAIVEPTGCDF